MEKLGLVIVTYNRPEYLKECFESLERADISPEVEIVIVDDASTDKETIRLLTTFSQRNICTVIWNDKNEKISACLLTGFNYLKVLGCTVLMNLDSDAIVRNDFLERIGELQAMFPADIITGFNCLTKNADGTDRHKVISEGDLSTKCGKGLKWNEKASVGGLNMCFDVRTYEQFVKPALQRTLNGGNWDHQACISVGRAICTVPSVVQHIGIKSSLGHQHDRPDTADDFKPLALPSVTLLGVDTYDKQRLLNACKASTEHIEFGDVVMITEGVEITSKEQYSHWIIKEAYKHCNTSHMLIIQYDGYVLNWKAWDPEWLQYDYIGATWWYKDGKNVGNGGFSLRSRKLMEIVANDALIKETHPEDAVICRTHRERLEREHGIKFAPENVADKFSIEGYNQPGKRYTTQFGFHGSHVDRMIAQQGGPGKTAIILQYFGIGDIIFSIPIAEKLQKDGYRVLWPVKVEFLPGLRKAYPHIHFEDWKQVKVDYNCKEDKEKNGVRLVPLRWTYETMKVEFRHCMRSKYDFMGMDWNEWNRTMFKRDEATENRLMKAMGIEKGDRYILINENFRTDNSGRHRILVPANGFKVVRMGVYHGYSLFDWAALIENAETIHSVSTSIIYLMELLPLKAKEVHIYVRHPDEKDHRNYDYILKRHNYILK